MIPNPFINMDLHFELIFDDDLVGFKINSSYILFFCSNVVYFRKKGYKRKDTLTQPKQ